MSRYTALLLLFTTSSIAVKALESRSQVWVPQLEDLPLLDFESPGRHRIELYSTSDFVYTKVSLGSPPQTFTVLIDTITSDLWIPNTAPKPHHLYNHSASSTYQANGSFFTSPYVTGIVSMDVLHIGEIQLSGQLFGEAIDTSPLGPGYPTTMYDGMFGLGFDSLSSAGLEPPLHHMMRKGLLDREMFSLYVGRNGSPGELILGGYDSTRFKGELIYIDCVPPTPWTVNVDGIQVGGLNISDSFTALISTMNALVFGPTDSISQIAEQLGGKEEFPGFPMYSIDCDSTPPDVTFILDGHPFSISKDSYILPMGEKCRLAFIGGIESWMLGTALLSEYYAVFDMNNKTPRIGFAEAR